MMERVIGLVVVLCLVLSATRAEEEAMSAVDLTEDTFKDKVGSKFITLRRGPLVLSSVTEEEATRAVDLTKRIAGQGWVL
jgi:hypothetical protein